MFASLPSPDKQTIFNLNHLLYSFLWDNKPNKISQKQITNDYLHGGLKMIDIEMFILSQKVAWIRHLFVSPESPWVQVFLTMATPERLYMMGNLWPLIFSGNISNQFWKEVSVAWGKLLEKQLPCENEALLCPLWYNSNISIEPLCFPHWYHAGIYSPSDLLNKARNIMELNEICQLYKVKIIF